MATFVLPVALALQPHPLHSLLLAQDCHQTGGQQSVTEHPDSGVSHTGGLGPSPLADRDFTAADPSTAVNSSTSPIESSTGGASVPIAPPNQQPWSLPSLCIVGSGRERITLSPAVSGLNWPDRGQNVRRKTRPEADSVERMPVCAGSHLVEIATTVRTPMPAHALG